MPVSIMSNKFLKCLHTVRDFDYRVFRLDDDGRKWKSECKDRFSLYKDLANRANEDGSGVYISIPTMVKGGGSRAKTSRLLRDLEGLGCLFSEVHIDRNGSRRERVSQYNTKVRRLWWERLAIAQAVLDSGSEFLGHDRLTDGEYCAIQDSFMDQQGVSDSPKQPKNGVQGVSDSKQGVSDSPKYDDKESQIGGTPIESETQPPLSSPPSPNRPQQQRDARRPKLFSSWKDLDEKLQAKARRACEEFCNSWPEDKPCRSVDAYFQSHWREYADQALKSEMGDCVMVHSVDMRHDVLRNGEKLSSADEREFSALEEQRRVYHELKSRISLED